MTSETLRQGSDQVSPQAFIENVCRLAADRYLNAKPVAQAMKDLHLVSNLSVLTTESILPFIRSHPELVDQWLRWSADKRAPSGWYFRRQDEGCEVGFYPKGERLYFSEIETACAEFIIREVPFFASLLSPT